MADLRKRLFIRTFASVMHGEGRQPEAVVHDHGTHLMGQFERQLRVLEIERRRTPVALPFVNGTAERAIKSVRLEMLNHRLVRNVEELEWYLDEYKTYYKEYRANQAIGSRTPAAFGRDSLGAEVITLDEVRQRRLVRKSFAYGLLNAYKLVDEESAAAGPSGAVKTSSGRASADAGGVVRPASPLLTSPEAPRRLQAGSAH